MHQLIIHPFEPIFDCNSTALILGSLPSPASRANYYYGHPQNCFWQIMAKLFGAQKPETREEKRTFVLSRGIALWDVLHSCEIAGAEDSSIKNPVPNEFQPILKNSKIKTIFTNGKKATELFKKLCAEEAGISAIYLPSTSPANRAQQAKPMFIEEWGKVANCIRGSLKYPLTHSFFLYSP